MNQLALQPRICTCNQLGVIAAGDVSAQEVTKAIAGTWMANAVDLFFCAHEAGRCSNCGELFAVPADDEIIDALSDTLTTISAALKTR